MIETAIIGHGGGKRGFAYSSMVQEISSIRCLHLCVADGAGGWVLSVSGQGFASVRYQTRNRATNQPPETWRDTTRGKGKLPFDRSGPLKVM